MNFSLCTTEDTKTLATPHELQDTESSKLKTQKKSPDHFFSTWIMSAWLGFGSNVLIL